MALGLECVCVFVTPAPFVIDFPPLLIHSDWTSCVHAGPPTRFLLTRSSSQLKLGLATCSWTPSQSSGSFFTPGSVHIRSIPYFCAAEVPAWLGIGLSRAYL